MGAAPHARCSFSLSSGSSLRPEPVNSGPMWWPPHQVSRQPGTFPGSRREFLFRRQRLRRLSSCPGCAEAHAGNCFQPAASLAPLPVSPLSSVLEPPLCGDPPAVPRAQRRPRTLRLQARGRPAGCSAPEHRPGLQRAAEAPGLGQVHSALSPTSQCRHLRSRPRLNQRLSRP